MLTLQYALSLKRCSELHLILQFLNLLKLFYPPVHHFIVSEIGNKRKRRLKRGQSLSHERKVSALEAEASQRYEIIVETLSDFENVCSVRNRKTVPPDGTQNENEIQVLTLRG